MEIVMSLPIKSAPFSYEELTHMGWTVFAMPDRYEDGLTAWGAINQMTGAEKDIDMCGREGFHPSAEDFRLYIELDFPTRDDVSSPSTISRHDLDALKAARDEVRSALRAVNETSYAAQGALQNAKARGLSVSVSQMMVNTLCTTSDRLVDAHQ